MLLRDSLEIYFERYISRYIYRDEIFLTCRASCNIISDLSTLTVSLPFLWSHGRFFISHGLTVFKWVFSQTHSFLRKKVNTIPCQNNIVAWSSTHKKKAVLGISKNSIQNIHQASILLKLNFSQTVFVIVWKFFRTAKNNVFYYAHWCFN